jgi:hypothetical protein
MSLKLLSIIYKISMITLTVHYSALISALSRTIFPSRYAHELWNKIQKNTSDIYDFRVLITIVNAFTYQYAQSVVKYVIRGMPVCVTVVRVCVCVYTLYYVVYIMLSVHAGVCVYATETPWDRKPMCTRWYAYNMYLERKFSPV